MRFAKLTAVLRSATLAIFTVGLTGCPPTPPPAAVPVETPPRILVLDDPQLADALAANWTAMFETKLDVKQATREEAAQARRLPADVIIYPTALLGDLAYAERISPLTDDAWNDSEWDKQDLLDKVRKQEIIWDRKPAAVSLGAPAMVMWMRGERMQPAGVTPPQTWPELASAAEQLSKVEPGSDRRPRALVAPLADGSAWITFLSVAAGYVVHRDQLSTLFDLRTMEPRIAAEPFVRALEELSAALRAGGEAPPIMTPDEVRAAFLRGDATMALTWPAAGDVGGTTDGFTLGPLPGANTTYDWGRATWIPTENGQIVRGSLAGATGLLASVTADAKRPKQAARFLTWLSGKEAGARLAAAQSLAAPTRFSQLANPQRWVGPEFSPGQTARYGEILRQADSGQAVLWIPRLPNWTEYSAALDQAVRAAVTGEKSAPDALAAAAARWQEITAKIGVERQRQANERALGIGR